jgi:hypothetical protein
MKALGNMPGAPSTTSIEIGRPAELHACAGRIVTRHRLAWFGTKLSPVYRPAGW